MTRYFYAIAPFSAARCASGHHNGRDRCARHWCLRRTCRGYTGPAHAQNLTEKVQQLPQRPVGFADIVEKVKPAVISVRVKIDRPNRFHPQR